MLSLRVKINVFDTIFNGDKTSQKLLALKQIVARVVASAQLHSLNVQQTE